MEKVFDESDMAYGCWEMAGKLINQGLLPEQAISFGNRALRILIDNVINNTPCFGNSFIKPPVTIGKGVTPCLHYHKSSLYMSYICNLIASACCKMKMYDCCSTYLNSGYRTLTKLEADGDSFCDSYCLLNTLQCNQGELFNLKLDMCRFDETVIPLRKQLAILETMMDEGCIELGKMNEKLCANYLMILKYKEALPFCFKALEIYTEHLGPKSVEVAKMTRHLAIIHNEFKEYAKALEQNQLSQDILRNTVPNSPDFFKGEGDTGCILVGLGSYEQAIGVLERVVSCTEAEDNTRFLAYVNMAKAFYYLGKRAEAKKQMQTAQNLFKKKEMLPHWAAIAFGDMSVLYEKLNDFGRAKSSLTRALRIPNIPQKFLLEGSTRLFSLISISGKEKGGIAYMEDVVENLKRHFGPEHHEVGYGYRNLGAAYLKFGEEELALKFMEKAKDMLDVTLGPHHLDSLKTSQALAETYATLMRYARAVEIQEKLVECLKMVPSEEKFLAEAVTYLNKLKEMEANDVAESPQPDDSENCTATNLRSESSEDGKLIIE